MLRSSSWRASRLSALLCLFCPIAFDIVSAVAADGAAEQEAERIRSATDVRGGFVVHLGCKHVALTAALRGNDGTQVHGLDTDPATVAAARKQLLQDGLYGPVTVDRLAGSSLPYIDNFVNLVVAEDATGVTQEEIERVLCPGGVGYVKTNGQWRKFVKPRPSDIDDWSHYFHSASGNAVAHDQVVAPPERLQWVGSPRYSRHHDRMASLSAMVSTNGRLFYIMDEGSRISIELPSHWQLIARDAFNGTVLWKKPIEKWHDQMWPLKSGPTQLARRLVSSGDEIYVTLGLHQPVSRLDAVTGEVKHVYEGTQTAEEMLLKDGVLFVLVNKKGSELDEFAPKLNTGDQQRVATEFLWNEQPREIHAIDTASGKMLWTHTSKVVPLTLCADDRHLVFHDGDRIVALQRKTGETHWATEPAAKRKTIQFNFGPRLVLHEDYVLYAGGEGKMRCFDSSSGKQLWESDHAPSGYQSPQDLIVTGGMVWVAPTTSGRDSGIYKGRDLKTGEVKVEFPPDIDTYWFHHRCYIAKATDRFLIPSRTGIELVDFNAKHWDINHWVRGGCLYGVMPCNGLLYAPPHDCACYPEAKLYGLNALAPALKKPLLPKVIPEAGRLERGPGFAAKIDETDATENDWPTYRHDAERSGSSKGRLGSNLDPNWEVTLSGRLSSLVAARGLVYVAQIDQHTLHALDGATGTLKWSFTAGGRIDSPPSFWKGRLLFGSADGWVYALRAEDGELLWKYRAAPIDRRLMSFEQLESVWPVHGSILVERDVAHFVVGRSSFLDGGMWYLRLNPRTGEKLSETVLNDRDPNTGRDLQEKLQTLQMPVALNDLLCSDGECVYLRSQKFDFEGNRQEIGPVSGNAIEQGGTQTGKGRHLFAPMGFLDDTWFHRSYWVYGKNFAGGHNGYYQAGKHTPSGRILVFNDKEIFGYARQPQYYRWTTPLEHQMFSASRDAVSEQMIGAPAKNNAAGKSSDTVSFANTASLDPAKKALTVEAWVKPEGHSGVIVAHGGPANGYALALVNRKPTFYIRATNQLGKATTDERVADGWNHIVGVLETDKTIKLYLNGSLVGTGTAPALVPTAPKQALEFGGDSAGSVGDYQEPFGFTGSLDEVRIFHRALTPQEIAEASTNVEASRALSKEAALACTFDAGNAKDESGHANDGTLGQLPTGQGRVGTALVFPKAAPAAAAGQPKVGFDHTWTRFVPVFARSMVLANDALVVAGPEDVVDEEYALERLAAKDPAIHTQLKRQDEILDGQEGGRFWVMSTKDGSRVAEFKIDALPVWDGMSTAFGRIYIATTDGRVLCYGKDAK
jgi:outer membrane protein assembly factor BamB